MNDIGSRIPNGEASVGGSPIWSVRDETRERDTPPCLPWRHHRRNGMRSLQINAPARAPGGTFPMWARAPPTPRSLCG